MFKSLYNFLRLFFFDDKAFEAIGSKAVAKARGILMLAGLSAAAFATEIIETGGIDPKYNAKIKLAGVVVAGLSVMLRAGEKNSPAATP